jgi:hypothetical protein
MESEVQWLFDQLNNANHEGTLNTVAFVIKLETSDGDQYTKDAALMNRLRQCYAKNLERVKALANDTQ